MLVGLAAFVLLAAPQASANVGLPMIVVAWPIAWLAFVPVALLEGLLYRRALGISVLHALRSSFLTNLFSTALGIPLAWGVPLLPALAFASSNLELPRSLESFFGLLYWPFWLMPWGDKAIQSWSVLVALSFLIPLFLATSVLSEAWLLRFLHPAASRRQRWAVSLRANVWSYSFLALALLVFVVAKHITGEA
jgi:hypothetical protein